VGPSYRALLEALAIAERLSTQHPDQAQLFHLCGRALDALGRNEEAAAKYQRAAELDPDHESFSATGVMRSTRSATTRKRPPSTRRAAELDSHSANTLQLDSTLYELGRKDEAPLALESAAAIMAGRKPQK
jgi:tetratricopeptide (TPR) repeat protein